MTVQSAMEGTGFKRRALLAGMAGASLLALPGCASFGGYGLTEAIRRILLLSSERAFARLTAPGGFWDSSVARLDLPDVFGRSGNLIQNVLTTTVFKATLQRELNYIAEKGADRAAPLVADAVRTLSIPDALAILKGGSTAASDYLHGAMGNALVEAMVPELSSAMRLSQEPIVGQAIAALTGVDVSGVARSLSSDINTVIWNEIGREEAGIRAEPGKTNDPVIIAVLGGL